jgi:hypothetical protein
MDRAYSRKGTLDRPVTAADLESPMPMLAAVDGMDVLAVVVRVMHIGVAIIAAGAVFFQFAVVHPAMRALEEAQRRALRGQIVQRWRPVILICMILLVLTGLVNFLAFKVPYYRGTTYAGAYHALFGLKLLAALLVFHPATLLVLPGEKYDRQYRDRAGFWLAYMLALLALVILLGAVLNNFDRLAT